MNNSKIIAFSIIVLSGSILFGCGAMSPNKYGQGAIAIGCILMTLGTLALFVEAINGWSFFTSMTKKSTICKFVRERNNIKNT